MWVTHCTLNAERNEVLRQSSISLQATHTLQNTIKIQSTYSRCVNFTATCMTCFLMAGEQTERGC